MLFIGLRSAWTIALVFMILTAFFIWHFGFRSRAKSAGINALNPSSD